MSAADPRVKRSWRRIMLAAQDAPGDLVEALWQDCEGLMRESNMVKPGDRTTIVSPMARDGRRFILKRANLRGPLHTVLHLRLRSRAMWMWRNAQHLQAGGLRTPRVFAVLEERIGPLRLRSYFLSERIGGVPLLDWMQSREAKDPDVARMADEFASVWRGLGRLGLAHRDMKATNFMVDDEAHLWLIDLDGMRRLPRGPLLARARRRDRSRFLRNWQARPEVQALFRARIDTGAPPGE